MNNNVKEEFAARIANATPAQLILINYEIIFEYLNDSKLYINDDKKFQFAVTQARKSLKELRSSLNFKYDISKNLMQLYNYADQQLSYYSFNKKESCLKEAERILKDLFAAWETIEKNEKDKTPVMQNTQQIYAGLTYGRNGQFSEYVEHDVKRGFKA